MNSAQRPELAVRPREAARLLRFEGSAQPVHSPTGLREHLAQMMLIEVLRLHLADKVTGGVGWLFALADKQISATMTAMHENPGYRWTSQKPAERAGMSRSAFALRFKEKVGTSVMEYLTHWRMLLAGDRLVNSRDPLSAIALSLGYESESASASPSRERWAVRHVSTAVPDPLLRPRLFP